MSFSAAVLLSKMGIIIFSANMYCRSNQPAGFSYGIKCNYHDMCSNQYCHKYLQVDCRKKGVTSRIKGSYLPFVSMQDFLFFQVVSIYISLRCISSDYSLIVKITKRRCCSEWLTGHKDTAFWRFLFFVFRGFFSAVRGLSGFSVILGVMTAKKGCMSYFILSDFLCDLLSNAWRKHSRSFASSLPDESLF